MQFAPSMKGGGHWNMYFDHNRISNNCILIIMTSLHHKGFPYVFTDLQRQSNIS